MILRAGVMQSILPLREAGDEPHSNVAGVLRDAVRSDARARQGYAYYVDHTGDGENGDCVFETDEGTMQAPYAITKVGDKTGASIDTSKGKKVRAMVQYRQMANDDDYYTTMQEALCKVGKLYVDLPIYERFISKDERDKADSSSFAGKGKSFPILKSEDVKAAVRSIGRAGSDNYSSDKLKANIIRIAKAKGWENELPEDWRAKTSESAPVPRETKADELKLEETGSCQLLGDAPVLLKEARTDYPVMLISPGTGSTAHYPAEVLERDGPKVFKRGTLMFWNHQTAQESSQRPEGDLDKLAAILTEDARYDHAGPKGPGLYGRAKVMADYAQRVEERAPHIGLSIRAGGTTDGTKVDGKPRLKSIDYAESVDYVTKAGRGGLALAEAARDAGILPIQENEDMTREETQALVEAAVKNAVAPFQKDILRRSAREEAMRCLEGIKLPQRSKDRIADAALRSIEIAEAGVVKDGELVVEKFREVVVKEAKSEAEYLAEITGAGNVTGMGPAASPFAPAETAEQIAAREAREARQIKVDEALDTSMESMFAEISGDETVGKAAARRLN